MKRSAIILTFVIVALAISYNFWGSDPQGSGPANPKVIPKTAEGSPTRSPSPSPTGIQARVQATPDTDRNIITSVSTFALLPEENGEAATGSPESTPVLITIEGQTPSPSPTQIERELLTPEEVAALASSANGDESDGLGRGLGMRAKPQAAPKTLPPTPSPSPTASPSPTPLPLVGGQARGYAMLYAMHPNARQTVERHIQTLIDARILQVYLGILMDGTFSKDLPYVESILQRLARAGRQITLSLYLTNGPTMRDYEITPITVGFNRIDPIYFRSLIKYDPNTRSKFLSMAQEVKPLFELNSSLGEFNRNIAIPMLEDNLDRDSYGAMRTLASSVLGSSVQFMRNPCVGCYDGNDSDGLGNPIESHIWNDLPLMPPGSGFTLDGTGVTYPGLDPVSNERSDALLLMMRIAYERRLSHFGLWRGDWQGRYPNESTIPHPDQRIYGVSTPDEAEFEISLLREGLIQIVE